MILYAFSTPVELSWCIPHRQPVPGRASLAAMECTACVCGGSHIDRSNRIVEKRLHHPASVFRPVKPP